MTRTTALIFILACAGCAQTPSRIETASNDAPDKSYTVDLPVGWIKQASPNNKKLFASRNGFLLEVIAIANRPRKEAFPKTKKGADDGILPAELAELAIAEIKGEDQFTGALNVVENEPVEIAGHEGFRIRVSFKNARGLEIQRVVEAFTDKTGYYELAFQAPALYFFDTYYPDFQKAAASFRLASGSKSAGIPPHSVLVLTLAR